MVLYMPTNVHVQYQIMHYDYLMYLQLYLCDLIYGMINGSMSCRHKDKKKIDPIH